MEKWLSAGEIGGATYFFNGKGQMQAGRWLHLNDDWEKMPKGMITI